MQSLKVGFGLITCQAGPGDRRSEGERYREAVMLAEEAERLGFDSVWVSEHHFVDDGYMSALLPVCAAIAARTGRILIGTGVLLAPLYQPLRLAEDAATVDQISGGRLILGLGQGWRSQEFMALGVPLRERAIRLEETVRVLRGACPKSKARVGEQTSSPKVTPAPWRPGGPPIWVGASSERAVRRAARIADGFLTDEVGAAEFSQRVSWALDELADCGRETSELDVAVIVPTLAWPTPRAWERVRESEHYMTWKYSDMAATGGIQGGAAGPPALGEDAERRLLARMIVGDPVTVANAIQSFCGLVSGDVHYIARMYWPGLDFDFQCQLMQRFAEQVLPLIRQS